MTSHAAISIAIDALEVSQAYRLFSRRYGGIGSLLMFHRVLPPADGPAFAPNARLAVSTTFFQALIEHLQRRSYEFMTVSQAKECLGSSNSTRKFVCLTFDDGYRDNYEFAYQISQRYHVPITIYLVTGFLDRTSCMWWLGLEKLLGSQTYIQLRFRAQEHVYPAAELSEKSASFSRISQLFTESPPQEQQQLIDLIGERYSIDFRAESDRQTMTWRMVRDMADSGDVEFGAHTVTHRPLLAMSDDDVRREMADSRLEISERLGRAVDHFAYPFGGRPHAGSREFRLAREVGFATAVTTRHGNLMPAHREHLTCLPRLSINGHHQDMRSLRVYLSGASAALASGLNPVVTD